MAGDMILDIQLDPGSDCLLEGGSFRCLADNNTNTNTRTSQDSCESLDYHVLYYIFACEFFQSFRFALHFILIVVGGVCCWLFAPDHPVGYVETVPDTTSRRRRRRLKVKKRMGKGDATESKTPQPSVATLPVIAPQVPKKAQIKVEPEAVKPKVTVLPKGPQLKVSTPKSATKLQPFVTIPVEASQPKLNEDRPVTALKSEEKQQKTTPVIKSVFHKSWPFLGHAPQELIIETSDRIKDQPATTLASAPKEKPSVPLPQAKDSKTALSVALKRSSEEPLPAPKKAPTEVLVKLMKSKDTLPTLPVKGLPSTSETPKKDASLMAVKFKSSKEMSTDVQVQPKVVKSGATFARAKQASLDTVPKAVMAQKSTPPPPTAKTQLKIAIGKLSGVEPSPEVAVSRSKLQQVLAKVMQQKSISQVKSKSSIGRSSR